MAFTKQGQGTTFKYGTIGMSGGGTKLSGVIEIGTPKPDRGAIEETDLDSLAQEWSPGLNNNGTVTLKLKHSAANWDWIQDKLDDTTLSGAFITYNGDDSSAYYFNFYLKSYDGDAKVNNLVVHECTLQISGVVHTINSGV